MKDQKRPVRPNPADFERRARRTVARRLRKCRRARKITQTTLAEHVGVTYQQIQKYETGRDRLSIERLMLIAKVLDVPVERLLGGPSWVCTAPSKNFDSMSLTADGLESLQSMGEALVLDRE